MRQTLSIFLFFLGLHAFSQDSLQVSTTQYALSYGETLIIDDITLTFKDLSADSRCPKEVTCIRAGEAIALIEVSKHGKIKHKFELTFFPHGVVEDLSKLLEKENILIKNLELLPYPKALSETQKEDYVLRFEQEIAN